MFGNTLALACRQYIMVWRKSNSNNSVPLFLLLVKVYDGPGAYWLGLVFVVQRH